MRAVCLSAVLIAHLAVATGAAATPHAGSRDLSFGHNGRVVLNLPGEGMRPSAIAVQSDGKIVIAGTLTASSNTYPGWLRGVPVTVRLLPNGRLDSTYGAGGISRVAFDGSVTIQGLAIQPDGALLLSGIASPAPGKARGAMARLQPSGAVDRTFGSEGLVTFSQSEADRGYATGVQSMSRLAVMPDGRIVAAGSQESVDVHRNSDPLVARLTPDGGLDSTFGKHGLASYGPERPTAVVVRPDGEVVIVGVSDDYFGGTDLSVSPLNPGPSSRPAYEHYCYSLTGATASAQPDGSVLFIGNIEAAGVRTYLTWAEVGENGLVERAKVRTSGVQAATVDARGAILTAGPWLTGRDSPLY